MRRRRVAIAAWLVVITSWACGDSSLIIRPEVPAGRPPAHLQERFDHYRSGYFVYEGQKCWFVAAGKEPPGREFRCGRLLFGLVDGTTPSEIAQIIAGVNGILLEDSSEGRVPRVLVEVPPKTEGASLLKSLLNERLTSANVLWSGDLVS